MAWKRTTRKRAGEQRRQERRAGTRSTDPAALWLGGKRQAADTAAWILATPCPDCGATAGQTCAWPRAGRRGVTHHRSRLNAAQVALDKQRRQRRAAELAARKHDQPGPQQARSPHS